ncbi:MAG TPA: COQ9 family protein [Magnetospirillaceae bacterium]
MSDETSQLEQARDAIVMAMLTHVPFDGWTRRAMAAAAKDAQLDVTMADRAFTHGPVEAAAHFALLADRKLEDDAKAIDLVAMRFTARVAWLVRRRLEAWNDQREAVRHAVGILALPGNAAQAARTAWHTADTIWHLAGDTATDFNYYTKRAILVGVYTTTLLCWLDDNSEDHAASWEFLDRRLADVGRFGKFRSRAEAELKKLPNPLRGLQAVREKFRPGRNFGER